MTHTTLRALAPIALCFALACGDTPPTDEMDAGRADAGPPTRIEDLAIDETITMEGLSGPVNVVRDERGFPHVYGADLDDVFRVEGYLLARDRFAAMEVIRRNALGLLSECFGALGPSVVELDRAARVLGYRRGGRAIYESLAADAPSRRAADAFVAGINQYIQELRDGRFLPRGTEALNILLTCDRFDDWEPADVFALGRFQAASLHDYGRYEVARTRALAGEREAFDPGNADPQLASRAGTFVDLYGMRPAHDVYTRPGFLDRTPSSLHPGGARRPRTRAAATPTPSIATLDHAMAFMDRAFAAHRRVFGMERPGSNNWVVDGAHGVDGVALLANDPHLSLLSPPLWWMAHLDTARAGGDVEAMGVTLPGLPGILLGHNRRVSWGATVTAYDVSDVYDEQITPGVGGMPDTVLFRGAQVPIETVSEVIHVSGGADVIVEVEIVPHHGPIMPDTRTDASALSLRWAGGDSPSDELGGTMALLRAASVGDGMSALERVEAFALNWVLADDAGSIGWTTRTRIPVRDPRACSYDVSSEGAVTGIWPNVVLPGQGDHEWTGFLDAALIPSDRDPAQGYLATANSDPVGVTRDGNPCNDRAYVGGGEFVPGERLRGIALSLEEAMAAGPIDAAAMMSVQARTRSTLGEVMRDDVVASLERAIMERATPGSAGDDALAAAVLAAGADMDDVTLIRDRLASWSLETPHGVGASGDEAADSVATTLFNVLVTRLVPLVLNDEVTRIGPRPSDYGVARFLDGAFGDSPATELATYDDVLGDTPLFDDLDTPAITETRDERILSAALAAFAYLESRLGADVSAWRWGQIHRARIPTVIPLLPGQEDVLSIPAVSDPELGEGFPRPGDWEAVDVANIGLWGTTDFSYTAGPSRRFVIEMHPGAPRAYDVLPGGEIFDPDSPHFSDEAMLWSRNEAPALWFEEADVVAHAESRTLLAPSGG